MEYIKVKDIVNSIFNTYYSINETWNRPSFNCMKQIADVLILSLEGNLRCLTNSDKSFVGRKIFGKGINGEEINCSIYFNENFFKAIINGGEYIQIECHKIYDELVKEFLTIDLFVDGINYRIEKRFKNDRELYQKVSYLDKKIIAKKEKKSAIQIINEIKEQKKSPKSL